MVRDILKRLWAWARWHVYVHRIARNDDWPAQWEQIKVMQRTIYDMAAAHRSGFSYPTRDVIRAVNAALPAIQAGDRIAHEWPKIDKQ